METMNTEHRPRIDIPGGGFVELLDVMGSDLTVVNAARVSMAKESAWDETCDCGSQRDQAQRNQWPGCGADERSCPRQVTRTLSERDQKLIGYLARENHFTPFAQPQLQWRIRMPIFVARQWFKSQVGISRNEVSRRYVDDKPEFFVPTEWRARAESVKQGSGDVLAPHLQTLASMRLQHAHNVALEFYAKMLKDGIAPEMARIVLPQSMLTELIEVGSLAAYARIIRLRDEAHAQHETGEYARAIRTLIEPRFPVSVAALLGGRK